MKNVTVEGFYKTDEGLPAFVYEVELHPYQEDLDGKFQVQFAAVERGEGDDREARFALNFGGGNIHSLEWNEGTRALVDDLIENRKFIAYINYDNTGWEDPGGHYEVMMGRDFGKQFDVTQRLSLGNGDIAALREIRDALNERHE